ncbi:MAG: MBL fold metallo-hydrolase [Pseudomonadota bacterium]|jgi:7,8-dihydropterin-6-yl-methyl-4-(beta-D-ribofuranosyl)aminobenzene 5'-phosphate synthase
MAVNRIRRRIVLGAAATVPLGLAPGAGAFAQRPDLQVPTVDSLVIRVLTDSSYDTPRVGASPWVRIRRAGLSSPADFRKTLHNEWGLSLWLESRIGSDTRRLLLDFGYTPNALLNNMEIMGIDGAKVQALIVSHGHYDHFGGLIGFLEKYRDRLPADLPLYVGGEDAFCMRKAQAGTPGHFADWGVLDRKALEKYRVRIVYCEQPTVVLGHAFTTGNIARRGFERVLPNTLVEYFKRGDVGCDIPAENAKAQGKPVPDMHIHEHGTCFNVRERGLVVISSCGHTGIINTARQAMEVSGIKRLHAAVGGFHLFPAPDDYVRQTIAEFKALDPDVIIPMHCSGPTLVAMLRSELADRLITSTTGTEYTFGG